MAILRYVIILIAFFGVLYVFRAPLQTAGPTLTQSVLIPLQRFFYDLKSATSSIAGYKVLPGTDDSIYPTGLNSSTTATVSAPKKDLTTGDAYTKTASAVDKLPPVKSDAASHEDSALTVSGIIRLTNVERSKKGMSTLTNNSVLNKSATAKVQDMFSQQYFEHVSPSGVSVTDLVNKEGYQYIVIGENLALGNFGGDAQVLAAWMASPGHRANILDPRYDEIGVAVGRGMYNGRMQWLAVQHFGKPLSSCPVVDSQLKSSIESTRLSLEGKEINLTKEKADIDKSDPNESSYRERVIQYNDDVQGYNRQLEAFKTAVEQYNESVKKFNSCAGLTS